jgi:L-serine deaminase
MKSLFFYLLFSLVLMTCLINRNSITASAQVASNKNQASEVEPSDDEVATKFKDFKKDFAKKYKDDAEETLKKQVFKDNYKKIINHNKKTD